jgi:hypothetical protein
MSLARGLERGLAVGLARGLVSGSGSSAASLYITVANFESTTLAAAVTYGHDASGIGGKVYQKGKEG